MLIIVSFRIFVLLVALNVLVYVNGEDQKKDLYIVYMGDNPSLTRSETIDDTYVNVLSNVKGSDLEAKDSIIQSYNYGFKAFAARLSRDEAKKIESMDEVVSVFPNRYHKLHTTKSWDFLGFPQTIRRNTNRESDVIVALVDTGISPSLESFNDKGFGPPPAKWKGKCGHFANFSGCNNKVIGARYFKFDGNVDPIDPMSPADVNGHGTHTSSTLAGNVVENANLYGLAQGTARGAVPSARIAMYKVCWASTGCSDIDLLAAFEAAIHDGVDVISISIGGGGGGTYAKDSIAIGAFHAMKRGIITVASAGNNGPLAGSVENHAPWIVTVAASGINRQFRSKIMLGNGKSLYGIGINTFAPTQKQYPLVSGADAGLTDAGSRFCVEGSLDPKKVKGKLVYCELQESGTDSFVKEAGAVGTILASEMSLDAAQILMVPGTVVEETIGEKINKYIHSRSSASAVVYKSEEVKVAAPFVASFSSRGPNTGSDKILKPDIAAPGVDILAAYTPLNTLTGLNGDSRFSKFSIMSGTSMACPHVAGTAAYIKSFHPGWSPSAIRSAIITTATPFNSNSDNEFSYGAGQVNPRAAIRPGLVYDMDALNYIQFLCHEGYKEADLKIIAQSKSVNCSTLSPGRGIDAINYPSMQLSLQTGEAKVATFRRTVTNVGPAKSIYNATINADTESLEITVKPMTLSFTKMFQKRSFTMVVNAKAIHDMQTVLSASLVWSSGKHTVRSPIVVYSTFDESK
ncbi:hypothetical protein AQUCO_01300466v1 [Aquilegia coerulea]|uniref:Uncharacterized protein n=1 Tax=Aquilegia coerulea TaxID=218851 RepID=A0A2G5E1U3_AQUCA|nr:hypothetical protein AQUCO_01300466v1 [Aquilegia coerulea]